MTHVAMRERLCSLVYKPVSYTYEYIVSTCRTKYHCYIKFMFNSNQHGTPAQSVYDALMKFLNTKTHVAFQMRSKTILLHCKNIDFKS